MRERIAVTGILGSEVVTFDDTRKTLAYTHSPRIDPLAHLEDSNANLPTDEKVSFLVILKPKLPESASRSGSGLRQMSRHCPIHTFGATGSGGDLDRPVAVSLLTFDLGDSIGFDLDDGDWNGSAITGEYSGHAALDGVDEAAARREARPLGQGHDAGHRRMRRRAEEGELADPEPQQIPCRALARGRRAAQEAGEEGVDLPEAA